MADEIRRSNIGAALAALTIFAAAGHAIESPKPQAPATPAQEPPKVEITPADERAFYEQLQRVAHRRNLRDLGVSEEAIAALGRGAADLAVAALNTAAAANNPEAIIALLRVQHWCGRITSSRPPDPGAQISKLGGDLPAARAARIAGVIHAEAEFFQRAREGCSRAEFDYDGIEARLRRAADAGHPASATELAQFVRDPAKRAQLLQTAVDKSYAPAQYTLATQRLMAVQRGQTTENVGSIRLLLKQSGRFIPRAKLDLANCMALGCDGHPADALTAHAFGIDAARDGEGIAFLSMVRMPWGRRLSRTQLLGWQYFGDRLNEAGCSGDAYVASATTFAQTISMLEKNQPAALQDEAKRLAEELWRDNGARAMKEQGCG